MKLSKIIISTALGYDGRGIFPYTLKPSYRRLLKVIRETNTTVIAKSATTYKHKGNFNKYNPFTWRYIQKYQKGLINAYGLTNPGISRCSHKQSISMLTGLNIIPSYVNINRGTGGRNYTAACLLPFDIFEYNCSCPNIDPQSTGKVLADIMWYRKAFPEKIIIAKIGYGHSYSFSNELKNVGVDVIHSINSIPYNYIDVPYKNGIRQVSPLRSIGGGGVSGNPAWSKAFNHNEVVRSYHKGLFIMGCGVSCMSDVNRYFGIGADHVSICTLALLDPDATIKIIKKYNVRR